MYGGLVKQGILYLSIPKRPLEIQEWQIDLGM